MSAAPANSNQTGGLAHRIAGRPLTAALAALGTVVTLLGTGLSLIGLCCGGALIAAGGARPPPAPPRAPPGHGCSSRQEPP
ncbi:MULTISPECIES: hypothetical protein [Streptomyces]|uniref:hypothetical protein n=1 Tax=Streptomyces TaxID=1883 RepID=UPI0002F95A48|nr:MULTISPECIES: hypothetical protein [Streptomyces]MDT9696629.1 hypothetical protein [Streptomyces sp. P17]